MGRVNTPALSEMGRQALEEGYRQGKKHGFRQRCQLVLLKSEGRSSKEVGAIMKCHPVSVNSWVARYKALGIEGLHTTKGRGRKPILQKEQDEAMVKEAVKSNRQRLSLAKAEFEASSGKQVSLSAFRAFLKALADDSGA